MAIQILDPVVASRIAAGEVVERPASALRELLDNAIDSGADKVSVWIEEGGIKSITVSDNGCGIPSSELHLAFRSHATSKIKTLDDLYRLNSLGFRGEALCSIAAVSSLTIQSDGKKMTCDNGICSSLLPGSVTTGTTVCMENLFENIPARKQFLRRASSEYADCRKIFIEKALGFENVEFLLFNDNSLDLHFQSASGKERAVQAMALTKEFAGSAHVIEMSLEEEPVRLLAIAGDPSCYRRDRTQVRIFVNNRVVDSYQLVQAVTSSFSVALPGGVFPYFYLYIENSPSLTDFNIHPSKRECKLRNASMIYGMVTRMIRSALLDRSRIESRKLVHPEERIQPVLEMEGKRAEPARGQEGFYKPKSTHVQANSFSEKQFRPSWLENAKQILGGGAPVKAEASRGPANGSEPERAPVKAPAVSPNWKYIGQIFNTYLVVENGPNLLFIDQHAAHERILFEELKKVPDVQKLVIPYRFETTPDVDDFLMERGFIYQELGITVAQVQRMVWEIVSIPAAARKNEEAIANFIKKASGDTEAVQKDLFAIIACHSAVRAGDVLDNATAIAIIEKTFELDAMLCPHGRSFTYSISKAQLDHEVGRDI